MIEKIPMEGVNTSGELVWVSAGKAPVAGEFVTDFLRLLSHNRINMNLLIYTEGEAGAQVSCCVAGADGSRVKGIADSNPGLMPGIGFHETKGLISIFPHRSSLKALGLALTAFGKADLPLYGLSSSLSALTFITDYTRLEEAYAILEECLDVQKENGM